MGKKKRLFIDKVVGKKGDICPICGEARKQVKLVKAYNNKDISWRYDESVKRVCACNRTEVFS